MLGRGALLRCYRGQHYSKALVANMSSHVRQKVELYYDVVSPYSWIAFEVLCRYRSQWNIDLKFKPFFLGGVMQESGNKPPGLVPNKSMYMGRDLIRLKKHYGIPINFPSDPQEVIFKKGSLAAQRFLTAIDMKHPDKTEPLSRELWMRIWSRDEDITAPESFSQASRNIGLSEDVIQDALTKMKDNIVKDRLKLYTQEALDHMAFGAPTIVAHTANGKEEVVFGSDRFHILADLLGETYVGPLKEMAKL